MNEWVKLMTVQSVVDRLGRLTTALDVVTKDLQRLIVVHCGMLTAVVVRNLFEVSTQVLVPQNSSNPRGSLKQCVQKKILF